MLLLTTIVLLFNPWLNGVNREVPSGHDVTQLYEGSVHASARLAAYKS